MRQRLGKSFFSSVVYFVISLFPDFILILLFHSPRLWLNLRVLDICLRFACQTKWFLFLCCCSVVIYLFIRVHFVESWIWRRKNRQFRFQYAHIFVLLFVAVDAVAAAAAAAIVGKRDHDGAPRQKWKTLKMKSD